MNSIYNLTKYILLSLFFFLIENYENEDLKNIWQRVKTRNYTSPTSYLWPRWLSELIALRDVHNIIHAKEKISIGIILFAWCLHIIFWYLLAVYLDNINPGKFGSSKPWYYLCKVNKRSYNSNIINYYLLCFKIYK